eukprot:g20381.t1
MRRVLVLDGVWNPWYASRGLTLGGRQASLYDPSGDAVFARLQTVRLFGRPLSVVSVSARSAEGSPELPAAPGPPSSTVSDLIFVDSSRAARHYLYFKDNEFGYIDAAVMQVAHSFFDAPARGRGATASKEATRLTTSSGDFRPAVAWKKKNKKKNFGYLVSDGNYDWRPGPTQFHMFSAAALVSKHVFGHLLSGDSVRALKAYQVEENFLCAPSVLCAELHGILFALRTLKAWWRTASADQRAAQFGENEATSAAKFMKDMDPLSSASSTDDEGGSTRRPTTHVPLLTDSSHSVELLRTYFKHGFQLRTASNDEQHSTEKVSEKLNRAREQDNALWSFVLDHLKREQRAFAYLLDYTRATEWWSSGLPGSGAVEVLSSSLFNNMLVRKRRERRDRMEAFAEAQAHKVQTLQVRLQEYLREENSRTNAAIQDMNAWARDITLQREVGSESEPLLRCGAYFLRRLEEIVAEKRARDSKKTPSGKTARECGIKKSSIDVNLAAIRSNLEKPPTRPIDVKNRLKKDIFAQRSLHGLTHQWPTAEYLKEIGLQVFSDPSRTAWRWFANPIDRLAAEAELRKTYMADGFAALKKQGENLARLGRSLNADESGDYFLFSAGVQDLIKTYHVFLVELDELHRVIARERILLDLALFDDYERNPFQRAGGGVVYSKNKNKRRSEKDTVARRKDAIADWRARMENECDCFVHSRLGKVVEEATKQLREVFWPGIAFIDFALVKAGSASEEGGLRAKLTEMQLRNRQELFVQVRQHFERARDVLANELTDPHNGRSALWKTMDIPGVPGGEDVLSAYEEIAQSTAAWWASKARWMSDEEDNESEQADAAGSEHGEADHGVAAEDYHGDEVEAEGAGGGDHGDDQDGAGEHDVKEPGGHGHQHAGLGQSYGCVNLARPDLT